MLTAVLAGTGCRYQDLYLPPVLPGRDALPQEPGRGLRGVADYHAHMFSDMSFGGLLFSGKAFVPGAEPYAMSLALAPCGHARLPHLATGIVVSQLDGCHSPDGYPEFRTWPTHDTHVHQQMYLDWLHRAYRYGLRLVVITVTNSEVLCRLVHTRCDDMAVVDAQIRAIYELARYVASWENGWLEVVTTPADARRVIEKNRLAVVIGAEVDSIFDCRIGIGHTCTPEEVRHKLDYYHDVGLVQINPIHLVDNGFGGAAMYDERLSAAHHQLRGYYEQAVECADGVEWQVRRHGLPLLFRVVLFLQSGSWYAPPLPPMSDPTHGHCNARGLTELGRIAIGDMMARGFIIDAEHMSQRSIDETLDVAEQAGYPIMLSHAWPRALKLSRQELGTKRRIVDQDWNEQRSEMHRSAETLVRIHRLGGVVGFLANQGRVREDASGEVPNTCDTSSRSVAQALLYLARLMAPDKRVGFGTDVNGLAGQPGPRFGDAACGGRHADPAVQHRQAMAQERTAKVRYDGSMKVDGRALRHSVAGGREFDFNVDGLAHYGLLPDLMADFQAVGVPRDVMDGLFHSAEAYIEMWQRAARFASKGASRR